MGIYPASLEKLIEQLSRLPGIGQKSAARVALYILRSEKELATSLARSLIDVKEKIRFCSICFNIADEEICPICRDPHRDHGILCIVEGPGDQLAIEESGIYRGRYHVLHGTLAPLDGIGPEDLKIRELLERLPKESVSEVVLATNPTTEGEATASFLVKLLAEKQVRITRIALGVPMGGVLKYMDPLTLRHCLNNRVLVVP